MRTSSTIRSSRATRRLIAVVAVLATAVGLCAVVAPSADAAVTAKSSSISLVDFGCANPANHSSLNKLLPASWGKIASGARCFGTIVTPKGDKGPAATSGPSGLAPADIQSAYGLPRLTATDSKATVAIVDAYDDPNAEADLKTYRAQFGLSACTTANGCFKKVGQDGSSKLPSADAGWAEEISLDLDAVSAACQDCSIVLVEANSASDSDLMTAVKTAINLNPAAISLSWGGTEDNTITGAGLDGVLQSAQAKGIPVTVSTGDSGYGVEWPASSRYVTAVGGTTLTKSGSTWSEKAWSGSGSGCSKYEPALAWQQAIPALASACKMRAVADVAADADPNSGLAIYDTYNSCPFNGSILSFLCSILSAFGLVQGATGWVQVGGTSLASPLVASVYALIHAKALTVSSGAPNQWPYANPGLFSDVTNGSNGSCGTTTVLCTAGTGWDGPTGLGTPKGSAIFSSSTIQSSTHGVG